MSDIAKIEDAYLRGTHRFRKWLNEREKRFYKPLAEAMTSALTRVTAETIDQLPQEVLAELERLAPGALAEIGEGDANQI